MEYELRVQSPGLVELCEVQSVALVAGMIRVRPILSTIKQGTEYRKISGTSYDYVCPFDRNLRIHRLEGLKPSYPASIGNMYVGQVVETWHSRWRIDDVVFGYGPIRTEHVVSGDLVWGAGKLCLRDCLMFDPALVAAVAHRCMRVCLGDVVWVSGLGAIGQCVCRMAMQQGARVFAYDPNELRRRALEQHGGVVFSNASEAVFFIKECFGGADVCFELSGKSKALSTCLEIVKLGGGVGAAGFYEPSDRLVLAGNFLRNNVLIRSIREVDYFWEPGWSLARLQSVVIGWLSEFQPGKLLRIVPWEKVQYLHQYKSAFCVKIGVVHEGFEDRCLV